MPDKKILITYYSRSGHVEKISKELAQVLGAELDKITPDKDYEGKDGYNRAGNEALFRVKPGIKFSKDPSQYDLVIIGSPMWVFTVSSPIRSYISSNREKIKNAAFFSSSGSPFKLAIWSMERTYKKKPIAIMQLREEEIDKGLYNEKVKKFIDEIKKVLN